MLKWCPQNDHGSHARRPSRSKTSQRAVENGGITKRTRDVDPSKSTMAVEKVTVLNGKPVSIYFLDPISKIEICSKQSSQSNTFNQTSNTQPNSSPTSTVKGTTKASPFKIRIPAKRQRLKPDTSQDGSDEVSNGSRPVPVPQRSLLRRSARRDSVLSSASSAS